MKQLILVFFVLFSTLILQGEDVDKDIQLIVDSNNKIAIDLYHQIKGKKDNFVFSPFSISSAVAMAYTGARASTRDEIEMVFDFPSDNKDIYSGFLKLNSQFSDINKDYRVELVIANSIWIERTYHFLPDFVSGINKSFEAEVQEVNFKTKPSESTRKINSWVLEKTKGRIENIINGLLNPLTRLALVNALYFKGKWRSPFWPKNTGKKSFWVDPDKRKLTDFMYKKSRFKYSENKYFKLLEMAYDPKDLSMIFLLPIKKNGLAEVEEELTTENLNTWIKELSYATVEVDMPKFTIHSDYDLIPYLKRSGINKAFKWPGADLSGIDGTKYLFIEYVLHKTFIEIDEQGTEAAAATAILGTLGSAGPGPKQQIKIFNANHPFIYLIRENNTGTILFIGRLMNPGKK